MQEEVCTRFLADMEEVMTEADQARTIPSWNLPTRQEVLLPSRRSSVVSYKWVVPIRRLLYRS